MLPLVLCQSIFTSQSDIWFRRNFTLSNYGSPYVTCAAIAYTNLWWCCPKCINRVYTFNQNMFQTAYEKAVRNFLRSGISLQYHISNLVSYSLANLLPCLQWQWWHHTVTMNLEYLWNNLSSPELNQTFEWCFCTLLFKLYLRIINCVLLVGSRSVFGNQYTLVVLSDTTKTANTTKVYLVKR